MVLIAVAAGCSSNPNSPEARQKLMGKAGILPVTLRCEYLTNPLGIDANPPRLSWAMESNQRGQKQTAYQVLVASTPMMLENDRGDLWDTGKVDSAQSIQLAYAGRELNSGQRCYWKVRVWNKDGLPSAWSEPAFWEMGLLKPSDWTGKWINDGKPNPTRDADFYKDDPAPLFRKPFALDKRIKRARLYISGLGYYEAYINGARIGDHVLDPGWTTYSKRVLYSTYDVTEQVRRGENCIGVMLGNGWYNPLPMRLWAKLNLREHLTVGRPRFIAQLNVEYADGTSQLIATDRSWKTTGGPILRNNVYLGEVYDARQDKPGWNTPDYRDSWLQADFATEPIGTLRAQMQPPIRSYATLKPVGITQPKPDLYVVDMGQNFAGTILLRAHGPAGTTIKLRYGELLYPDGTVNLLTSACGQIKPPNIKRQAVAPEMEWQPTGRFGEGAPALAYQGDTFILRGKGRETFSPRFTFHGFRYIEVSGYPGKLETSDIEGLPLCADVEDTGYFSCSDPLLNRIQTMCQWTFRSNLFSVQSDCPHREKFGYGGDIVPTSDAFLFNFNMAPFYSKVVNDFADAVRENGGMTETAPYVGISDQGLGGDSGPIGWMLAHPLLQQKLYQYAGDRRLMEQQYEATKRLVDFIHSKAKDNIIDVGISDHESLDPKPVALTATAHYYHHASLLAHFAAILGKADDAQRYQAIAEQIKAAFIAEFLKPGAGQFDTGTEACQSFALWYDLVPADKRQAAFDVLVDAIVNKHKVHVSTGIFGTRLMFDVLSRFGRADLAYAMASQKDFPGWGHMLEGGATTLWETWAFSDNTYSHNHPMFGSISAWFYETLGGIRPAPDAVGFDKIIIRPAVGVGGLHRVNCAYMSVRGRIFCHWQIIVDRLWIAVEIPPNTVARVYVPGADPAHIAEVGNLRPDRDQPRPADQAEGVRLIGTENGSTVYEIQPGSYLFTAPWSVAPTQPAQ